MRSDRSRSSTFPVVPLPPPYAPHSSSPSSLIPLPLLLLFPSMTPPPRYVSPSPMTSVMGPSPTPYLSSQSTLRIPAPVASNPTPASVCVPTSINHRSLIVGWLLAMLSPRPSPLESLSLCSVERVGLVTPGVSVVGESPRACPPQDHDVGPSYKQALLASAATATALLGTASLPPYLSKAPEPTGFIGFPLPDPPDLLSLGTLPMGRF